MRGRNPRSTASPFSSPSDSDRRHVCFGRPDTGTVRCGPTQTDPGWSASDSRQGPPGDHPATCAGLIPVEHHHALVSNTRLDSASPRSRQSWCAEVESDDRADHIATCQLVDAEGADGAGQRQRGALGAATA